MRQAKSKLAALLLLFPTVAMAHPGHGAAGGLLQGLGHPLSGVDHLLAMVAVGLWAAQLGKRATWAVPTAFVSVMIVGAALGFAGALSGTTVPFVEQGIVASVFILGVLVASTCKLPLQYSTALVGVFALFHGLAHGAEMPLSMNAAPYAVGFILSTAVLHLVGIGLGSLFQKVELPNLNRYIGGAIALSGLYMAVS